MSKAWIRRFAWLGVLVIAVAAAGWPLYVSPGTDQPGETDVAYVIGPPTDERMKAALDLLESGSTDTLMVSVDTADAQYSLAQAACAGAAPFSGYTVLCEKPEPFSTRGEAQWLEREVEANGWTSASVITFRPQVKRAEMLMERCFSGDLAMIDSGESLNTFDWVYQYVYQTGAFMRAGLTIDC
ncbi:MAG: YdcF family protein [Demequina sp.]|uniref:YdcF family protein n=1 Tax=Demequina sp. TaxID=2050685 RepID=UPI003A84B9C3